MKLNRSIFLPITIVLGILFTQATPAFAQVNDSANALDGVTWYVATTGDDVNNDCSTPTTPCETIQGAIDKSTDGDTVQVTGGTYTGSDTQVVLITKSITLSGGWDAGFTSQSETSIIDGQELRRGITVSTMVNVAVAINHFTIQHGLHVGSGGGIYNSGDLTISDSIIKDNVSQWMGGGIYTIGTIVINNSTISNNTAGNNNSGGGGGGGIKIQGTATINNTAINNNNLIGGYSGSGIYTSGTVTLNNSIVYENTGANGHGIYAFTGTIILNNSSIANNQSYGFKNVNGHIILQNTIIAGNGANSDCFNQLGGYNGTVTSQGYNLIGNITGCSFTPIIGDLTNVDPLFGALTGSPAYLPLLTGSPAIDAGNPAEPGSSGDACLAIDQRGVDRSQGSSCDIGAYEYEAVTISGNAGTPGALVNYTENNAPKFAQSDESGNYSFIVSSGWSGTATPSKPGWAFTPDHIDYTDVSNNQPGQDYTVVRNAYLISGNTVLAGVTLSYEDNGPKSVISDSFGNYTLPVSLGWSGTVTPSHAGSSFLPVNRSYTNVLADSLLQDYGPTVSTIIAPKGATTDQTPTYSWTKIAATQYQYQLYKGNTLVYTKTVPASACNTITCLNTPATKLLDGKYKWRVRAMINGTWRAFTPYKAFTIGPKAGYWSGGANDFYVLPNQIKVDNFATYISVQGCGNYQIWYPPAVKIVNKKFAFGGTFYANGTFNKTNTRASGKLGLNRFLIAGCGYVSGGPFSWSSNWIDTSQPSLALRGLQTPSLLDTPGLLNKQQRTTPFIFTVDPE